jgi:hypothetical protein
LDAGYARKVAHFKWGDALRAQLDLGRPVSTPVPRVSSTPLQHLLLALFPFRRLSTMEDGPGGHRGRARSRTYSSEDSGFTGEIDALNAVLDGKPVPAQTAQGQGAPQATSRTGVSRKTLDIMTRLDQAAMHPPDAQADDRASLSSDDEEAAAERELADLEKKRRAGEAAQAGASAGVGAGAGAASGGGGAQSGASGAGGAGAGAGPGAGSGGQGQGARRRRADDGDYDVLVKVLLLGDSGVGKTSLMLRYSDDKFSPSLTSTAGVDYKSRLVDVEGRKVKCQIWDTAGQQRFHVITHSYYKSTHGIVLVYDVSEPGEER